MFRQVPVLPVVIPLAVVVFAALVWLLSRRGRLSMPRVAVALAVCVYVGGVVANTVFPIFLDKPRSDAAWNAHLHLVPLTHYELADAVSNIVVFLPVGILLPLLVARTSWRSVVAGAALFSLAIEVTQFVTAHLLDGGHIADVNDLLSNVVGGAVGAALFAVVARVPYGSRVIDRFRWPADAPDVAATPAALDRPAATQVPADHL